jgi:hypothetical protein
VLLGGKTLAELSASTSPSEPAESAAEPSSRVQEERTDHVSGDATEATG